MLSSTQKVSRALFKPVMLKGRRYASSSFNISYLFTEANDKARFSVVVPKKVEKSSVKRNYIKRVMYSLIREIAGDLKPGVVCAIFLKRKVRRGDYPDVKKELEIFFEKEGVFKK